MKQIMKIFRFEYINCVRNKVFIITTILLMGLMLLGSFLPSIIMSLAEEDKPSPDGEKPIIAVSSHAYEKELLQMLFQSAYPDYEVVMSDENLETLKENVHNSQYEFAVQIDSDISFKYINLTNGLYDMRSQEIYEIIKTAYSLDAFQKLGVSQEEAVNAMNPQITFETITTGTDITKNYFPVYTLMMLLFISITSYGQLVAQSVVSEKNTRAMELLITCAKPTHLMFGKVFGSGLAGLTQMALILLTAMLCFGTSLTTIPEEISMYLNFPPSTILLALLFFILGYFMYAFILGAMASFASKSEDLNTLTSPIVLTMTIVYMVIFMMMTSDSVEGNVMVFLSYFPITAPMAMFVRATLTEVAVWEIAISALIQLVTIWLLGMLASAIYQLGVLMYGNPPKPFEIFKLVRMQKKSVKMARKQQ